MKSYALSEVRQSLPALVDQAMNEPIIVTRHGKDAAVLISPSLYEKMLEAMEDLEDLELIEKALKVPGKTLPWEQVKKELGIAG